MSWHISRLDLLFKRLIDVTMATIGLVLLSPLLVVIAVAIKLHDGGPVFYRANRVGKGGHVFRLWKFRTMVINADRQGPVVTTKDDPRVTLIGRWLRRTKLDELPQLFNVLTGSMSLVGPRPEDPRYVARYTPEQRKVLNMRPGITSPASLTYRQEEQMLSGPDWENVYETEVLPTKLAIDLAYLSQRSVLSDDIELILRTIWAVYSRYQKAFKMITRLNRNRYILLIDVLLIVLGAPLAFLIRLDVSPLFALHVQIIALFAAAGLIIKPLIYWAFGLYQRFWRYASIGELLLIAMATTISTLVLTVLFLVILQPYGLIPFFPRSVLVIDWLLQLIFVGGIRFLVRVAAESSGSGKTSKQRSMQKRVLIAGAGDAGSMIVREIQHNPGLGIIPLAFVDDDLDKVGKRIHHVPVLGRLVDIPQLVQMWQVDEVVIAMPTAPGKVLREIVQMCEKVSVPSRTIPGVYELLDGSVRVNQLRNVEIEDLLRREPIQTDTLAISNLIRGKRVLVTGGGGSIGSEICRQLLRCDPAELVVVGHGENSVFEIHNELAGIEVQGEAQSVRDSAPPPYPRIHVAIADIRFSHSMRVLFEEHRPHIVFHAAAHKHVPLMELSPCEAITNNVLGTLNLLDVSLAVGVEHFVMISTDKAVSPTSIMGASKRVAELLVRQAAINSGKPYVAVRFGNVLGSRGSVVSLFKQQIAMGGPVTVTHPDMRRYFMTIPEAVQLVLQAAALGHGGEVFVLDMGEPVKIVDLARDLIELSGLEVGRDIDIVFTGVRPGEKLAEQLYADDELIGPTVHPKIKVIKSNAVASLKSTCLHAQVDQLIESAWAHDEVAVYRYLGELLPEAELTPVTNERPDIKQ